MTRLAVTGHRPPRLGGYTPSVANRAWWLACQQLTALRPTHVYSGMALGWDQAIAQACIDLRIPYTAVVPNYGAGLTQDAKWPRKSQDYYLTLLAGAERVEMPPFAGYGRVESDRNLRLVEYADALLALWDGTTDSGTAMTVRMAREVRKPVHNCWNEWEAV